MGNVSTKWEGVSMKSVKILSLVTIVFVIVLAGTTNETAAYTKNYSSYRSEKQRNFDNYQRQKQESYESNRNKSYSERRAEYERIVQENKANYENTYNKYHGDSSYSSSYSGTVTTPSTSILDIPVEDQPLSSTTTADLAWLYGTWKDSDSVCTFNADGTFVYKNQVYSGGNYRVNGAEVYYTGYIVNGNRIDAASVTVKFYTQKLISVSVVPSTAINGNLKVENFDLRFMTK